MKKLYKFLTILLIVLNANSVLAENEKIHAKSIKEGVQQFLDFLTLKGKHPIPENGTPAQLITIEDREQATLEINAQMATQFGLIAKAFEDAEESKKEQAVRDAAKSFNKELGNGEISSIQFINGTPSAVKSYHIFVLEKKSSSPDKIMEIMSSYKASPKPSDTFYLYSNALKPAQGNVQEVAGSDQTWQGPGATPYLKFGQTSLVKKCRKIIIVGWKCSTDFNHLNKIIVNGVEVPVFLLEQYNFEKNADHSFFGGDARTKNVVKGGTGLYLALQSETKILFVGFGYSWNSSDNIFTSLIQSEFRKDSLRLKSYFQSQIQ